MRGIERVQPTNPPFQKIEDAVRTTGLSAYFLRHGCRNGSIPCVRSGEDDLRQCVGSFAAVCCGGGRK